MSARTAPHLLAIDVGTLSARAGLFDARGTLIAARSAGFELMHPLDDHAVYRMDDIWAAVCAATRDVLAAAPGARIAGIAIDATSSTYFEADGARPLDGDADVICWMDHRGEAEAEEIGASGDRYLDYVGGTVSPEMYLPKILWLKRHRPQAWARVTAVRDLADEIARRATGVDRHSVCGLACKFPYLPDDTDPWRRALLAKLGIPELLTLGQLSEPPGRVGEVHGPLSAEAAASMGLEPGVPVGISLIDAEAGALGVLGGEYLRDVNRTLALIGGTSTSYMAWARDERRISGVWGPFKDAVFPGYWMHEAGQSISGAALDMALNHQPASPGPASADLHARTANEILALMDAEGPAFGARRHIVPDWLGNRAPLGDGKARALLTGIGLETSHRAFLEHYFATARALALQSRHVIEHLNRHGYAIDRVSLSGGHLKNPLLVRLYRDALGAQLVTSQTSEPVLLGTAMVAATAAGLYPDLFAALEAMAPTQTAQAADPTWAAAHDIAYGIYLKLFSTRNEIETEAKRLDAHASSSPAGAF
ncbi:MULTISPECIES: FGGY-family carbohydrate kinase [Rhodomicrobium]|uniref:FGGY-family carbohydrate kinase n=1 Tax=Rhodomicrobium TaxID=1068 RepID=UPI000B4B8D0F|nr:MULTISPECIES: FGGY-family carbohydrate kinase [Rhodomicrobium]